MPKKNSKKSGKSGSKSSQLLLRDLDEGHEYAEVLKPLGNCQFEIKLLNGSESIAKLKGSMCQGGRGFDRVATGNIVLVQHDSCTTTKEKYYIFHKYTENEKKQLKRLGELSTVADKSAEEEDDIGIIYEQEEEDHVLNEAEINDDFINDI